MRSRYIVPIVAMLFGQEVISLLALCALAVVIILDIMKEAIKHGQ